MFESAVWNKLLNSLIFKIIIFDNLIAFFLCISYLVLHLNKSVRPISLDKLTQWHAVPDFQMFNIRLLCLMGIWYLHLIPCIPFMCIVMVKFIFKNINWNICTRKYKLEVKLLNSLFSKVKRTKKLSWLFVFLHGIVLVIFFSCFHLLNCLVIVVLAFGKW